MNEEANLDKITFVAEYIEKAVYEKAEEDFNKFENHLNTLITNYMGKIDSYTLFKDYSFFKVAATEVFVHIELERIMQTLEKAKK